MYAMRRIATAIVLIVGCLLGGQPGLQLGLGDSHADDCSHPLLLNFPGANWIEVRGGEHLGPYDAILTCQAASAVVRATRPFGGFLPWEERDGWFWAVVPELTTLAVTNDEGHQVDVEVVNVLGRVFYSTDREVMRRSAVLGGQVSSDHRQLEEERSQIRAELAQIDWDQLTPGQLLGPWDMIWTGQDGRVEIEILQRGPNRETDPSFIMVIDSLGHDTGRRRLRSHTVFVMNPRVYLSAKVTRVLGEVNLARSKDQVRAFVWKYPAERAFLGSLDALGYRQLQEMLQKEHLE